MMPVVTGTAATLGQTFLMVLRIRCAGVLASNVVDVYINPGQLGGAPPAVPSATLSVASSIFKFARVYWYPGDGANNGSLDEFRLGTTYAAVAPVWPTNSAPLVVTTNLPAACCPMQFMLAA